MRSTKTQEAEKNTPYFLHDRSEYRREKIDIQRVKYRFSRDRITIVWYLWRHQQSLVTSSEKRWTQQVIHGGDVWASLFLSSFIDS